MVTDYTTTTEVEIVVWVDQSGLPVSTETRGGPGGLVTLSPSSSTGSTSATTTSSSEPSVQTQVFQAPSSALPTVEAPTPSAASASSAAASSSTLSNDTDSFVGLGQGIAYAPYQSGGGCKSQDEVNADLAKFKGFDIVRIYGVDCNQVTTVLSAARSVGMKVFLGITNINNVSGDLANMISQVNGDWSDVDTVAIGNEVVNQGLSSAADVVSALGTARGILKGAGYTGSIVTVDTFNAIIDNPELCQNSDYCAANCHAFFDPSTSAEGAGDFVYKQAQAVGQAAGGKNVVITESGWPSAGSCNGAACPGAQPQQQALSSLKSKFTANIFLFTAFNDCWKAPGQYGVEQHWGMLGEGNTSC